MIIVDINQISISNLMQQINITKEDRVQEPFLRHMILNSIRSINSKFRSQYGPLIIASDSHHYWRKKVFPYYKAKRQLEREASIFDWNEIFESLNKIKSEIKETFPFPYIEVYTCEADDIIATLCKNFSKNEKILIVSGDKDFRQLQKYKNVSQYSPVQKKFLVEPDPDKYLMRLILEGDKGDGVPNYLSEDDSLINETKKTKRISNKKIDYIIQTDPYHIDSILTEEEFKNFERNRSLIDLNYIPDELVQRILLEYQVAKTQSQNNDIMKVYKYLIANKLKALINNIDDFTTPKELDV